MSSQQNKILLVDDEERLLSALRRRLSGGYSLLTATGGREALKLIDEHPDIAVIVADMQMPEMNGIELLKEVKSKAPAIRRMMLTGNADVETAVAAINEGKVMRFLRKPCDIDELKAALNHAMAEYDFNASEAVPAKQAQAKPDNSEGVKNAFLSMMNHELRTPLNHIIGLASVLEMAPADAGDPQSLAYLKQIQSSGRHMLSLINRILEFSRLQSSMPINECDHKTDIIAIVNQEAENTREEADKKGVTVSIDSLRRHADIIANEIDIRLAVRELLSNAIKFNTRNGHISISIKCDKFHCAVRISDTGCGIPTDAVENAQQAFRQVDGGCGKPFEGVGLGLALVSTVAELNKGHFSVSPDSNGGTEAVLIFQRSALQSSQSATAA